MQPPVRNAIARIDVIDGGASISRGTGCLIAEGVLLTALHVVADRSQPSLAPYPGEIVLTFPFGTAAAEILEDHWDRFADWVLLRFDYPAASNGSLQPLPLAELRDDGMAWETYGFPDANPFDGMVTSGEVSNRLGTLEGNPVFQLFSREAAAGQGAPVRGLSGSPVVVQNAVVGILRYALMNEGQTVAGTVYACPIGSVLEKAGNLLPLPDPCFGLPGLPRQPLPVEPFRNLAWFTAREAEVFFGRNRDIRQMYSRLTADDAPPIVLLYGQSGVGKSSFLDAGVLPRLHWYHQVAYLRRDSHSSLLQTLRDSLNLQGGEPAEAAADLTAAWHAVEQACGKPLLAFFDQVEEAYTRPNSAFPNETDEFARELGRLFAESNAPRGRLVLSFRKEWLSDIQKLMEVNHLAHTKVFLEGLDRAGVIEAVSGLTLTGRLREFYGLTLDPGLPQQIAADLLNDPDSPIAPTLQILMTKMWAKATAESRSAPAMTADVYRALKQEGLLLGDFLDQQLEALRAANAEWVDSGLALDILACHTSSALTAKECSLDELLAIYKHRAADIAPLTQHLQDLFLLSDSSPDDARKATRLCHDTLAPVVRQRYARSEHPGQKSRRILEGRIDDWAEGSAAGLLDEGSLAVVEAGAAGMRLLTGKEQMLVEASRAQQRKREHARRVQRIAGAAATVIIIATAVFATWQMKVALKAQDVAGKAQAKADQSRKEAADEQNIADHQQDVAEWQFALSNGTRLLETDPPRALLSAIAAVGASRILNTFDGSTLAVLYHAINEAREQFAFPVGDGQYFDWSSDGRFAVRGKSGILVYDSSGRRLPIGPMGSGGDPIKFTPDGRLAQLGSPIRVWDRTGRLVQQIGGARGVAFIPDPHGMTWIGSMQDGMPVVFSNGAWKPLWTRGIPSNTSGPVKTYATRAPSPQDPNLVIAAGFGTSVWMGDTAGRELRGVGILSNERMISMDLGTGPSGEAEVAWAYEFGLETAGQKYQNWVSTETELGTSDQKNILFPNATICSVKFSPKGDLLAVPVNDGTVRLLSPVTGLAALPPARGLRTYCPEVAFHPSGDRMAVRDGSMIRIVDLTHNPAIDKPFAVTPELPWSVPVKIVFSPDGRYLAVNRIDRMFWWNVRTKVQHSSEPPKPGPLNYYAGASGSKAPGLHFPELTFSADGRRIAAALKESVFIWRTETGELEREIPTCCPVRGLGFDRGGAHLLVSTYAPRQDADQSPPTIVQSIALETGAISQLLPAQGRTFAGSGEVDAAFHPTADRFVADIGLDSSHASLQVWNSDGTPAGKPIDTAGFIPHGIGITADGKILFAHRDELIRYWTMDGKPLGSETRTPNLSDPPAVSPDGSMVFRPGATATMFDRSSGVQVGEFNAGPSPILAVTTSPDGRQLVTYQKDGTVRFWNVDWRQWLEIACNRIRNHPIWQEKSPDPFLQNDIRYAQKTCQELVWSKGK